MRRSVVVFVLLASVLAVVPSALAGSSSHATRLPTGNGHYQVRPAVVFLGATGGAAFGGQRRPGHPLGHIAWSSWDNASAVGSATYWVDNCKPNCAQGKFVNKGQVKLHAWHASGGLFTRLTANGSPLHHTFKWNNGWF